MRDLDLTSKGKVRHVHEIIFMGAVTLKQRTMHSDPELPVNPTREVEHREPEQQRKHR